MTEKNFIRLGLALWAVFALFDVAMIATVIYVFFHFVNKFW